MRTPRAMAVLAAFAIGAAACGVTDSGSSLLDKDTLVVGVKKDQPGLGFQKPDGTFEGFDVEMAAEVVKKLGKKIRYRALTSAQREAFITGGTVDLVFATYSITAERKTKITYAGPYYVDHQDILVRDSDTSIKNVRDLKGKKLCQSAGSNSWKRVTEGRKIAATLVPAPSYGVCADDLVAGRIDAVSTDSLILAGFAAARPGLKLVNAPFTDEQYGIGLKKGDLDGCEAVNRAVTELYQNGRAKALAEKWFAKSGLQLTPFVPQFDGCG